MNTMKTEFVRFNTGDGLILQGLLYAPDNQTDKAYLHIHGMAGNFYENRFLDSMAREITDAGYTFFSANNRGHDYIADIPIAGSDEKFKQIGNAYEKFEECIFDIKAGIDFLEKCGYKNIVLCGHSLGSVKVVYYVAKTQDKRIEKLILMSPPDMVWIAEKSKEYKEIFMGAQKMISEGSGDELMPVKVRGGYHLSANTCLDLGARGNPVDVFNVYDETAPSVLKDITIPTLAFLGEKDDVTMSPQSEALRIIKQKAMNAPKFDTDIIEGATHCYFEREDAMAKKIIDWLNQ
jgi:alpha-beta hydrolase superfamily lysophospholipase